MCLTVFEGVLLRCGLGMRCCRAAALRLLQVARSSKFGLLLWAALVLRRVGSLWGSEIAVLYRVIDSRGCIMARAMDVGGMGNEALLSEVERLVKVDRTVGAALLVHLGEVDARKLYLARGYSSMFTYCRAALGMSEAEAYLRMRAADVGRRFPLVLERFGSGDVHLSAIKLLAPHLTHDNHAQLLDRVRGKSKREIEVIVAELAPKPDVPARMRKLPERALKPAAAFDFSLQQAGDTAASQASRALTALVSLPPSASASISDAPASAAAALAEGERSSASQALPSAEKTFALQPPPARAVSTALSPGRYKLELTLGQEAHDQLVQLQALFRHQNPSGDLTSIVERAISELLERTMTRRFAQARRPRAVRDQDGSVPSDARGEVSKNDDRVQMTCDEHLEAEVAADAEHPASLPKSRYVPRKVLREVFARDAGQCTFVSPEGRRCSAREFLEVHHHEPFARGGATTVDNLRLSCRAHNQYLAELDYGRGYMGEKIREATAARGSHQSANRL
jgi:hypothetical protein